MPTDQHDEPVEDEQAPHTPDAPPTDEQAHAADEFLAEQDPQDAERVAEHHREMDKIGAEVKGEGEIA